MQVDDLLQTQSHSVPQVTPNVDYTEIPPIQQKRTIAFVNHFIMNAVSFLNKFAQSCESRFMQFEYKMQKVEASLLILEAQLSSIPGFEKLSNTTENCDKQNATDNSKECSNVPTEMPSTLPQIPGDVEAVKVDDSSNTTAEAEQRPVTGKKASDDHRYARFFKMLRVGVQEQAVKLKMRSEGFDPSILDNPDAITEPDSTQDNNSKL